MNIIRNMPSADYFSTEALSSTGARNILRSPAHYQAELNKPDDGASRVLVVGRAAHMAVLEPELFEQEFALTGAPDRRCKLWKQFDPAKALTEAEGEQVLGLAAAAKANGALQSILASGGEAEVSFFGELEGVPIKCRFDWISYDGVAVDLKTALDARAGAFGRAISSYGYHVQAAFYALVYKAVTGKELKQFLFFAIEKDAPHGSGLYELDYIALKEGEARARKAIKLYGECLELGSWPNYDAGEVELLSLPSWAITESEVY